MCEVRVRATERAKAQNDCVMSSWDRVEGVLHGHNVPKYVPKYESSRSSATYQSEAGTMQLRLPKKLSMLRTRTRNAEYQYRKRHKKAEYTGQPNEGMRCGSS